MSGDPGLSKSYEPGYHPELRSPKTKIAHLAPGTGPIRTRLCVNALCLVHIFHGNVFAVGIGHDAIPTELDHAA